MRKHRNKVDPDLQTNKQTNKRRYTDGAPADRSLRVCVCVCSFLARFPRSRMGLSVRLPPPSSVCVVLAHVSTMRPDVASITATASTTVSPHSASTAARPLSGNGPKWESA